MADIKKLNKIIHTCYEIYTKNFMHKFMDSDWSNVYQMVSRFGYIPDVEDIDIKADRYYNFPISNVLEPSYKQYNIEIISKYGIIEGTIQCHLAGSMDNPLSSYDIVLSLSPKKKEGPSFLSESVLYEALNFKRAIEEIKQVKTFDELKQVVIKYAKEGILAGTLIAAVLSNYTLSDYELYDLETDAYKYEELHYGYDDDNEDIYDPYMPQWDLIADNVETTVYNAVPSQCNNDTRHTASGFALNLLNPEAHRIIAMERTMMAKYNLKYGDLVKIEGTGDRDGVYQIQDTMNKRFKGKNKIDILINNKSKIGKWNDILIYKLVNPEFTYDTLKLDMWPAKNQASMDKRYLSMNESFNRIGLLSFGDDDEISFDKHKVKDGKLLVTTASIDLIKEIMANTLVNIDSPSDAIVDIDVNSDDIKIHNYDGLLEHYNILDISESGLSTLGVPAQIAGNGKRAQKQREQDLLERLIRKVYSEYYRILLDKNNRFLHICIHNAYASCKYFTFKKPLIDFIAACPIKIKSIGMFTRANLPLDENNDPIMESISEDLTFYFTKNWKGQNYYLPKCYKPGNEFPSELMLSLDFVNHFPDKIASKYSGMWKKIPLISAMFPNIEGYLKVVKKLVDANYIITDEYNNEYNKETIDLASDTLTTSTDPVKLEEKKNKIEKFLEKVLGYDAIMAFDQFNANKKANHFYIRLFNKFNRKQKNIYKKLQREVIKLFLIDNGVDLEQILIESWKRTDDQQHNIMDALKKIIDNNDYSNFDLTMAKLNYEDDLLTYDIVNNDQMIFNHINDYIGRAIRSDREEFHDLSIDVLLNRFYYKFEEKLIYDNPNGYNNKNHIESLNIFNFIADENGYTGVNRRWTDFIDCSLAVDTHEDLMYFFYDCAYALKNAYSQSMYGHSKKALKELEDAKEEPILNNINYNAIVKCLRTVLLDMTGIKLT